MTSQNQSEFNRSSLFKPIPTAGSCFYIEETLSYNFQEDFLNFKIPLEGQYQQLGFWSADEKEKTLRNNFKDDFLIKKIPLGLQ